MNLYIKDYKSVIVTRYFIRD